MKYVHMGLVHWRSYINSLLMFNNCKSNYHLGDIRELRQSQKPIAQKAFDSLLQTKSTQLFKSWFLLLE